MHPSLALASSLEERAEADPRYLLVGERGGQELHHGTVFVDGPDGHHALPPVVVERLGRGQQFGQKRMQHVGQA